MITEALTATIGCKPGPGALDLKPEAGIAQLPVFREELELEKIKIDPELVIKEHSYAFYRKCADSSTPEEEDGKELLGSSLTELENVAVLNKCLCINPCDCLVTLGDCLSLVGCMKNNFVGSKSDHTVKTSKTNLPQIKNVTSTRGVRIKIMNEKQVNKQLKKIQQMNMKTLTSEFEVKPDPFKSGSSTSTHLLPLSNQEDSQIYKQKRPRILRKCHARNNEITPGLKIEPELMYSPSRNEEKFRKKPLVAEAIGLLGYKKFEDLLLEENSGSCEVVTKFEAVELIYVSEEREQVEMSPRINNGASSSTIADSAINIRVKSFANISKITNRMGRQDLAASPTSEEKSIDNFEADIRNIKSGAEIKPVLLNFRQNVSLVPQVHINEELRTDLNPRMFRNLALTSINDEATAKEVNINQNSESVISENELFKELSNSKVRLGVKNDIISIAPNPNLSLDTKMNETAAQKGNASRNSASRSEASPFKEHSQRKVRLGVKNDITSVAPNPTLPLDTKVNEAATQKVNASRNSSSRSEPSSFKEHSRRKVRLGAKNDISSVAPNPTLPLDTKVNESATQKVNASRNSASRSEASSFKERSQCKVRLGVEKEAISIKPRSVIPISEENLHLRVDVDKSIGKIVKLGPKSKKSNDLYAPYSFWEEHSYAVNFYQLAAINVDAFEYATVKNVNCEKQKQINDCGKRRMDEDVAEVKTFKRKRKKLFIPGFDCAINNEVCGVPVKNPSIVNVNQMISVKDEVKDVGFREIKAEEEEQTTTSFTNISSAIDVDTKGIKREAPESNTDKYYFLKLFRCGMCSHTSRYRTLVEYHRKRIHLAPTTSTVNDHRATHYSICNNKVESVICKPKPECCTLTTEPIFPTPAKFKVFVCSTPKESRHYY